MLLSTVQRARVVRFVSIALVLACACSPSMGAAAEQRAASSIARSPPDPQRTTAVEIRVREVGWGNAHPQDVEAVLYSVAAILLENSPGRRLKPIVVSHSPERPMTLYKKGPGDSYQVQLTATGEQWARYAYEFAHELSHILMNYDHHANVKTATFNQWFEEALCEAASLYTLKRLAFIWEFWPPKPAWAAYAPQFEHYVARYLGEAHRQMTPDVTLAQWFQEQEQTLRGTAYLRDHNEVVANLLLPLFEENADFWEAIGYLNLGPKRTTFAGYLQTWHDNAPETYKDTILYIMGLFGVLQPSDATAFSSGEGLDLAAGRNAARAGVAGPTPRKERKDSSSQRE